MMTSQFICTLFSLSEIFTHTQNTLLHIVCMYCNFRFYLNIALEGYALLFWCIGVCTNDTDKS